MTSRVSSIGEILKSVFAQLEKKSVTSKEEIEGLWKELAGEKGFRHSRPTALRKNTLYVKVDSSGWLQELTMQKRKILKGLKRALGKDRIADISFKVGEF